MDHGELERTVDRLYEVSDAEVVRILAQYLALVRQQTIEVPTDSGE